jgi:MinD-like ATPase involved in chromosome partitioning or flagellar assembly
MAHSVSRLDRIITELEKLQSEAHEIYDAHVDVLLCDLPPGTSFGVTKMRAIAEPAGLTINHIKALKLLRAKFLQLPKASQL